MIYSVVVGWREEAIHCKIIKNSSLKDSSGLMTLIWVYREPN